MYNPKSGKATEFIDDREILDSLEYAQKNKNNKEVIDAILEKASAMKGISHREAAVLLECELEEENKKIEKLAKEIKQRFYGNRNVCSVVSVKLLCQWLHLLSISSLQ